jgi:hypothetical protein
VSLTVAVPSAFLKRRKADFAPSPWHPGIFDSFAQAHAAHDPLYPADADDTALTDSDAVFSFGVELGSEPMPARLVRQLVVVLPEIPYADANAL